MKNHLLKQLMQMLQSYEGKNYLDMLISIEGRHINIDQAKELHMIWNQVARAQEQE